MKNKLAKFKEKIYTCSKCGLCQSVCPIFEVTKDDTLCARGKYILLNGLLQDELEPTQELTNSLNICLKCNKCKDFCPSNLDMKEVLEAILEPSSTRCDEQIAPLGFKIASPEELLLSTPCKIIFHKPCHFDKMDEFFEWIKQNKQIDLISIETDCCGWGNGFNTNSPEIAKKISKKLAKKLLSKDVDYIVTACESCKNGIEQGLEQINKLQKPKVILILI